MFTLETAPPSCKKATFLQKYIYTTVQFVKKEAFLHKYIYTTVQFVKKEAFLHKMALLLQGPFFYATYIYLSFINI